MQALTGGPRAGLTADQVRALLHHPAPLWTAGAHLMTRDLQVVEDISADLVGATVRRGLHNTVHGTCDLRLTRELTWGQDYVRPYTEVTADGITARIHLGVYTLTTPERQVGEVPATYQVQGYDRLHDLDRPVGDTYEVLAGTEYLQAVRDTITAAGLSGVLLDGSATGVELPSTKVWPLAPGRTAGGAPATWLGIVNELLAAIGYRGVWADEDGLLRSAPYVEPSARPAEYVFDADAVHPLPGTRRTVTADIWATPNRWVFVQTNLPGDPPPEPEEGAGIYTYDLPDEHPLSAVSRGLVRAVQVEYDVADQATLELLGDRRVAADLRTVTRYSLTSGPFPLAGHADVFTYTDSAAVDGNVKVQATSWEQSVPGGDVTWSWEEVA